MSQVWNIHYIKWINTQGELTPTKIYDFTDPIITALFFIFSIPIFWANQNFYGRSLKSINHISQIWQYSELFVL